MVGVEAGGVDKEIVRIGTVILLIYFTFLVYWDIKTIKDQ